MSAALKSLPTDTLGLPLDQQACVEIKDVADKILSGLVHHNDGFRDMITIMARDHYVETYEALLASGHDLPQLYDGGL